jgi:cyclopropane fatty-acyl-phospholipid synthase-like methyltransferase
MKTYWESRYQAEGKMWGDAPSRTAVHALEFFRQAGVKKILVPGSGYGRNTRLLSESGFEVTGVEISATAYALALKFDTQSSFYNTSILDLSFLAEKYDAVYCHSVLHLFREQDRKTFIRQCADRLTANGLMFFSVMSEKDPGCGKGTETEKNTFESKPGRPAHYFSESDLKAHFKGMTVLETGIMEEPENHGAEGPHVHPWRYIYVRI